MEKHTSHEAKNAKHGEQDIERDHLGQGINPAIELEKENMAKAAERHEKEVKDAEASRMRDQKAAKLLRPACGKRKPYRRAALAV